MPISQLSQNMTLLLILLLLPFSGYSAENTEATLTANSNNGLELEFFSQLSPVQINRIHSWHIRLSDSGQPVSKAVLGFSGGMPEHDHGLPTQARVTKELEAGLYLLEGVRFHMQGKWLLEISIDHDGQHDIAIIEFQL